MPSSLASSPDIPTLGNLLEQAGFLGAGNGEFVSSRQGSIENVSFMPTEGAMNNRRFRQLQSLPQSFCIQHHGVVAITNFYSFRKQS